MSPRDLKLMQRPDAPIKREEALRWLARQKGGEARLKARSAASAGPSAKTASGNPMFVGVDPEMTPDELEAAMAAADARYHELETLAPWRDPRVPVSKSAPKARPRRRKGKKGRGKGKRSKSTESDPSLSGD
eukprot:7303164-Karenia_brevis.AAC.1